MHLVGEGAMLLKPGDWDLVCQVVDIQVLNQCSARHCHNCVKANIYVFPILINLDVGTASSSSAPSICKCSQYLRDLSGTGKV